MPSKPVPAFTSKYFRLHLLALTGIIAFIALSDSRLIVTSSAKTDNPNAASSGVQSSADSTWTSNWPAEGGAVYSLAVDPGNSNNVYAGTSSGKVYKSTDGGLGWSLSSVGLAGGAVYSMAIDPGNPSVIYAGTDAVYRSINGGASWSTFGAGLPAGNSILSLVIDPSTPATIYLVSGIYFSEYAHYGDVYKSTNGGASWFTLNLSFVASLAIDPSMPNTIYAGGYGIVFKSIDGGISWIRTYIPYPIHIRAIAIDPLTPSKLYAGAAHAFYASSDGGANWEFLSDETRFGIESIVIDPLTPNTIYVATKGGVYRSTDGGLEWGAFNDGLISLNVYTLAKDSSGRHIHAGTDAGVFSMSNSNSNQKPLIFIPGIAGSRLYNADGKQEELWPGISRFHDGLTLDPNDPRRIPGINAIDVIREVSVIGPFNEQFYQPLLAKLGQEGSHESGSRANLFVFPYDWRKSIADNSSKLKELIDRVRLLYPNTDVDLLAHSTGGLLARRYIIDHSPNNHHISHLVTIASPWLGAPKAINVMATGDFVSRFVVRRSTIKRLAEFFPGVHQLLPSSSYIDLGGVPFSEDRWDINENNRSDGNYSYDQLVDLLNAQFQGSPGTNGRDFHDYSKDQQQQDDWHNDNSGVKYYHIYGVRSGQDTISNLTAWARRGFRGTKFELRPKYDYGDKTVPRLSAARPNVNGRSLNAPNAVLHPFFAPRFGLFANDDAVEHTGLTKNPAVHVAILCALRTENPGSCVNNVAVAEKRKPLTGNEKHASEAVEQSSYYLRMSGVLSVTVTDASGSTTNPTSDETDAGLAGVTSYMMSEDALDVITPTDQVYTVTFRSGPELIDLDLAKGINNETLTDVSRYRDLSLPAGTQGVFKVTPQGIEGLRYDGDGDGTFETLVAPTASVSGMAAKDVSPPTVTISETGQQTSTQVTVSANDTGSGVHAIYYSLDGANFHPYTGSLILDACNTPVFYVFADDNIANRSSLATYYLSHTVSGRITDENHNGIDGATVTLNNGQSITTDADGHYLFADLPGGITYTLRPSAPGYTFSPTHSSTTKLLCDQTINFSGFQPTHVAPGSMLITEFRFRGPVPPQQANATPDGSLDEFIELYNNTDAPIKVGATDGSEGWAMVADDGMVRGVINNGTVIPPRTHYLIVNNSATGGYSLGSYAGGDAGYTQDITDGSGIALFRTADYNNFTGANRLDAVGFTDAGLLFRKGAGLLGIVSTASQHSYLRKLSNGLPQDTGANENDFQIVSTEGTAIIPTAVLGAPGPENSQSPVQRNNTIKASLIDGTQASSAPPNRVRSGQVLPGLPNAYGTLSIQRRFKNSTGAPVTRLRFRIVDITTQNAPGASGAQADLRVLSSTGVVTNSQGVEVATVTGLTLETPPDQPQGGGQNSTMAAMLPSVGLAPGSTIDVQFLLGVEQGGAFRFLVNVEALSGQTNPIESDTRTRSTKRVKSGKER
jgi:hypothetical protein